MILDAKAPAKVNLGLHVLRKRGDGYHDIETVFLHVPWHDHLQIRPAGAGLPTFSFTCSNPELPVDETNLCVKAANKLLNHRLVRDMESLAPISLHLEKRLPFGAGLGGGSSDAAHTLRLLNTYWALNLDDIVLHTIAAELGSDVPFFLNDSAMYATGRGELLASLSHPQKNRPYQFPFELLLVLPSIHVSTAIAYQNIVPNEWDRSDLRKILFSNDLGLWKSFLVNDFEATVFSTYPEIGKVKQRLYKEGAGYAAMSGSGSAVFGVFEDARLAEIVARRLESEKMKVWCSAINLGRVDN